MKEKTGRHETAAAKKTAVIVVDAFIDSTASPPYSLRQSVQMRPPFSEQVVNPLRHSRERRIGVLAAAMLLLIGGGAIEPAAAEVYQCRGADGKPVLTNRPKGLRGCVLVETLTPSSPRTGGSPPSTHGIEPGQDDQMPSPLPHPFPPLPPHGTPPEASTPATPTTPSADANPGDGSPCLPQVNPLNPLSGRACPPAPADSMNPEPSPGN